MHGFGWVMLGWLIGFVLVCVILANFGCMPLETPENPQNGAICMTSEMLDRQLSDAYAAGYQKAKADATPRADVELSLITQEQLLAFLRSDPCDRCMSELYDAPNSCLARASCLTSSARDNGWDCYGVILNFEQGAHAIVAFPLKDGGIVFVEPWYDTLELVEAGEVYRPAKKIIEEVGILK